ncbi:MAG: hypothetical protein M1816_001547 [Peltula sp. TS41687]|nr:MAG: hypothetical protein M1816_001547 [Peltula sp. TS41687]
MSNHHQGSDHIDPAAAVDINFYKPSDNLYDETHWADIDGNLEFVLVQGLSPFSYEDFRPIYQFYGTDIKRGYLLRRAFRPVPRNLCFSLAMRKHQVPHARTRSENQQATTESEPIPVTITSVAGLFTALSSNPAWTGHTVVALTDSGSKLSILRILVGCGRRCGSSSRGAGLLLGNLPINRPGTGPPRIFKFPGLPSFSIRPDGTPDSPEDKPSDQKPTETRSSDSSSSSTTSTSTFTSAIETGYVILARPGADTSVIDKAIKAKVNDPQNVDAFIPEYREVRAMWTTGGGLNQGQVKELSNLPGIEGIFPNKPVSMKSDPKSPGFVTPVPSASRSNALIQCTAMSQISNQV